MEHPPKQGLKPKKKYFSIQKQFVLMEHPPKQGLKLRAPRLRTQSGNIVLMEHPPKQGLKLRHITS